MSGLIKYRQTPSTKNIFDSFIEDFLNRDISNFVGNDSGWFQPAVNVSETDLHFLIELAAPGFNKADFEVKVEGEQLFIKGNHEINTGNSEVKFTRREFSKSTFSRSFTLPKSVNKNEVSAVYINGVLQVTLPKAPEAQPQIRTIEIGGN